jgi:hypothetical protein
MGNIQSDSQKLINNMTLSIKGQNISPSGREAELYIFGVSKYGNIDPNSVLPLYLQNNGEDIIDPANVMNLYTSGKLFNSSNKINLVLHNAWSGEFNSVNLFTKKEGKLDGGYELDTDMPLYIEKQLREDGMVNLYMLGHENPISSGVDLFISGKLPTASLETELFLANYKSTNNVNLYTRGFK